MAEERILVVDDETPVRQAVCSILSRAGFDSHPVSCGEDALTVLQSSQNISIVLCDLLMDGMDGLTLFSHLKRDFPEIPVIMVTGVNDLSVALSVLREGAYDYLVKPFEREQLLAAVRRAREIRRLRLENLAYKAKLEFLVRERTEELRKAIADLQRSYEITLEALGHALDLKDAETEGHSRRVTAFTMVIARKMKLSRERVRLIAGGAFLHDVGKMAIPDAILRKPGPLTRKEEAIMREHPRQGYKVVSKIPSFREAAEIVYSHQERYDGTGYPRGLKGDQIPLGARIFAIVDAFDAMTSDRPYRAACSVAAARQEIEREAGQQFDPEIVKIFLSVAESLWRKLRVAIDKQKFKS